MIEQQQPRIQTRFEANRKKRITVHKRDQVQWSTGEDIGGGIVYAELATWLRERDAELASAGRTSDELLDSFLEWYNEEYDHYGRRASDGVLTLYWRWFHARQNAGLDRGFFDERRRELAAGWPSMWLDGEYHQGGTLVQEFFWLFQGDWVMQAHLVEAIVEFREYHAAGRLNDWRRRKRRRQAAHRRKTIKQLYEQALMTSVPPTDSLLAPAPAGTRSRRRSHGAA